MLKASAPFPQVGSDALLIEDHKALPCRIIGLEGRKRRLIAVPGAMGASGNRRVDLDQLTKAEALSDREQAEYRRLDRRLSGQARPKKADAERFEHLRLRSMQCPEATA